MDTQTVEGTTNYRGWKIVTYKICPKQYFCIASYNDESFNSPICKFPSSAQGIVLGWIDTKLEIDGMLKR